MTTEIEKELFEKYGVGKKPMCEWTCAIAPDCSTECKHYYKNTPEHPPITAEKVLRLINIMSGLMPVQFAFTRGYEEVIKETLEYCIVAYDKILPKTDLKEQVIKEVKEILEG